MGNIPAVQSVVHGRKAWRINTPVEILHRLSGSFSMEYPPPMWGMATSFGAAVRARQPCLQTGSPALIAGRDLLRVLDYQDIFCPICGLLQAQAELFLDSLDKRGAGRVVG